MAQKVLTWSNSQSIQFSRTMFTFLGLRSMFFFVLYMYSVKVHFRCGRCGVCVDLYMICNYMLRIALGKTHKSILLQEMFFCTFGGGGGGVTQERFSNFSSNQFFQAEKLPEKPCQQGKTL